MYSTCLFCHRPLGANPVLEAFPVGRRLAFDARRGRLWVVCRSCERWNLTPLDERWEAVEECERLYRACRSRYSTDNIGLARLAGGLDLVRIGEPDRSEFAAWRYGDQFGRRRRRAMVKAGALIGVGGAVLAGGAVAGLLGGTAWGIVEGSFWYSRIKRGRVVVRIPSSLGRLVVRQHDLADIRLDGDEGVRLHVGQYALKDAEAIAALRTLMAHVNASGASRPVIRHAVDQIEDAGDPRAHLARVAHGETRLARCDAATRLAVEMAANEEGEREALRLELGVLQAAWRQAEEIAAIADGLVQPPDPAGVLKRSDGA